MTKVLYVEDSKDTAEAVKLILSKVGLDTDLAFTGGEGVAKASLGGYDIILLDIMLPDMSGWDVFEKIKVRSKAKFAFLSALPVSGERKEELKKAGVSDYITKPFEKSDLIRRVKKMVE